MTILDEIVAYKREYLKERRAKLPQTTWENMCSTSKYKPLNFPGAIRRKSNDGVRIIAEVKKASPSAGNIADEADPVAQAIDYARGGAQAISILTDKKYFKGNEDYLSLIRDAVDIPVMRKEFMIDPYQVYEARALGADALLLIAAVLSTHELRDLLGLTQSLGMEALVEIYEADELEKIEGLSIQALGVNNRNLKTFEVSLDHTAEILNLLPGNVRDQVAFVSESGIKTIDDVEYMKGLGVDAILVGETLMRSEDPAKLISQFTQ